MNEGLWRCERPVGELWATLWPFGPTKALLHRVTKTEA